jgi:hypothetical protein
VPNYDVDLGDAADQYDGGYGVVRTTGALFVGFGWERCGMASAGIWLDV